MQRLRAEQLALLCRSSQLAVVTSIFAALYVCWLLLSQYSITAVASWYGALLTISAVRYSVQRAYLNAYADNKVPDSLSRHSIVVLAGIAINGFVWCVPSTWFLFTDPAQQVMMTVFLVGLAAAGLGSLPPMRHAYACFMMPFMLPIAIAYLFLDSHFVNVAFGVFAFLLAMIATGMRISQTIEDSLRLQFANEALAAREQREKEVVARANRDLELQIAQRERTEAELRVAKAEAEKANRAKSQFLANMSHELRTPLNGVLGMSDLLIRALANVAQLTKPLKHAQTIRASGERLLRLIDEILDMARIEAGAMRLENRPFDPRRLITETVDLLSEQCAKKQLALTVVVAADVPSQALGDPSRLRQVLVNLVANAIKFTERGGVEIKLSATPLTNDANARRMLLRWSVIDTGIGIPDHAREQLFQPFSQVDDSSTRKFGGTGLGLAICRQIITALGGHIDVASTPGNGSTFWFEAPVDIMHDLASSTTTIALIATPTLNGRVLVAEDNDVNCQLIVEMLDLAGCKTDTAADGAEALEKIAREKFDAVLMDWHMPKLDGLAAVQLLRESEREKRASALPVIALTASVLPGDREACMRAGMNDFIPKPFTYEELVTVLQRWLPQKTS
jgi:signal transduction histidine kinase/CheY-like chemotaxis protein